MLSLIDTELIQSVLVCNALLLLVYLLHRRAAWPLTLLMLVLAAQMFGQVQWGDELIAINLALALCYGPILFALVRYLAWADRPATSRRHWIAPVLMPVLILIFPQTQPYIWPLVSTQLLLYAILISWQLRLFHQVLKANFSNLKTRELDWLAHLLMAFLVLALLDLCRMLIQPLEQPWQLFFDQFLSVAVNIGALIVVYLLIWRALKQQMNFHGASREESDITKAATITPVTIAPDLVAEIEQIMLSEKPYLDQELSIQQLADRMGWPVKRLSAVINTNYQRNFNDFINQYRIEHACHLLKTRPKTEKMLSIQLDSGFASKSVFNHYFKKIKGCNPSEYRKH